jgi:hypothetical protein
VARLCLGFDLFAEHAEGWRDLPDPPEPGAADPRERMSSA